MRFLHYFFCQGYIQYSRPVISLKRLSNTCILVVWFQVQIWPEWITSCIIKRVFQNICRPLLIEFRIGNEFCFVSPSILLPTKYCKFASCGIFWMYFYVEKVCGLEVRVFDLRPYDCEFDSRRCVVALYKTLYFLLV